MCSRWTAAISLDKQTTTPAANLEALKTSMRQAYSNDDPNLNCYLDVVVDNAAKKDNNDPLHTKFESFLYDNRAAAIAAENEVDLGVPRWPAQCARGEGTPTPTIGTNWFGVANVRQGRGARR